MGALGRVERFETVQRIRKRADLKNAEVLPGNTEDSGQLKKTITQTQPPTRAVGAFMQQWPGTRWALGEESWLD